MKDKVLNKGIIFQQETHSSVNDERAWKKDFGSDNLYFAHGRSNSCCVAICFCRDININVVKERKDSQGRILILEVSLNDSIIIFINLYNANTEIEHLKTFDALENLLEDFEILPDKNIIFGGDFNLFFDQDLEASGGTANLKHKSIARIIKLKEKRDLCDIWNIRNEKKRRYTFRKITSLVSYKEDWIIFLFQIPFKSMYQILIF